MAKKKKEEVIKEDPTFYAQKEEDKPEVPAQPKVSVTERIREAMVALGASADTESVMGYFAAQYPTWTPNKGTVSATLSTLKNKTGSRTTTRAPRTASTASNPIRQSNSPTLEELLAVAQIASSNGGVQKLRDAVTSIAQLAEEVGGIEHLRRCLDGLDTLSGKK